MRNAKMLFTLSLLICLAVFGAWLPVDAQDDQQDPPPPCDGWGCGGGGSCTYCSQTACGCAAPQPGQYLSFSCSCSSIQCTRTCTYGRL